MGGCNGAAQLHQSHRHLVPEPLPEVQGGHVEVAGRFAVPCGGLSVVIAVEQEELQLGTDAEVIAHLSAPGQHPLQHIAGIPGKGLVLCLVDVADQPCGGPVPASYREDLKGIQVRDQQHILFVLPDEALQGGTVKDAVSLQGSCQLSRRQIDVL